MNVEVGKPVPLKVNVECPDVTLYVQATIKNKLASVLATRDLTETSANTFTNYTYLMPDLDLIEVEYVAYLDPGYSMPATDYCPDSDVFLKTEVSEGSSGGGGAELSAAIDATGQVFAVIETASELNATIDITELSGEIEVQDLTSGNSVQTNLNASIE